MDITKVLFVDVGQGTCQVVLLGNQRAIVIDAGASPDVPIRLLRLLRINTIELLVLSHSHVDHTGGAAKKKRHRLREDAITGLVVDYQNAIEKFAYVYDSEFRHRPIGQYLCQQVRQNRLFSEQLVPFVASADPYPLWESPDSSTVLAAISPLGGHHLVAFDANAPNASSAVIELRHANDKIIFAADSEYQQWRDIYRLRGNRALTCKVLTMPHHGGLMQGTSADLKWFCSTATDSEVVVVSAATVNQHGHPRQEVVQAVSASGSHVMCTQITGQCCSDLEPLRPGVIGPPLYPCRSSPKQDLTTGKRRSRNVACAGTVAARLTHSGITVERDAKHAQGVDRLELAGHTPLCR